MCHRLSLWFVYIANVCLSISDCLTESGFFWTQKVGLHQRYMSPLICEYASEFLFFVVSRKQIKCAYSGWFGGGCGLSVNAVGWNNRIFLNWFFFAFKSPTTHSFVHKSNHSPPPPKRKLFLFNVLKKHPLHGHQSVFSPHCGHFQDCGSMTVVFSVYFLSV